MPRAARRALCKAGSSSDIRIPMIEITTSNSTKVKARNRFERKASMVVSPMDWKSAELRSNRNGLCGASNYECSQVGRKDRLAATNYFLGLNLESAVGACLAIFSQKRRVISSFCARSSGE